MKNRIKKEIRRELKIAKKEIKRQLKKHPKRSTLTIILLFTLIVAFFGALQQYNWISMLFIIIISLLICVPMIIGRFSHLEIPIELEMFSVIFIYATLFLGELRDYYTSYWWWDIMLHSGSGLAFGIIGFIILYILYKTEKIKTNPKTIAMFSFAFALALGALWEIFEFIIDLTFGPISNNVPMQGSLKDTMEDLIVDSLGALISSLMGYLYIKKESGIVNPLMNEFKKSNPMLFEKEK